jgi:hypothetical protein
MKKKHPSPYHSAARKTPAMRFPCIGGCGTGVLQRGTECRKCLRKRLHAGKRRIHILEQAIRVLKRKEAK